MRYSLGEKTSARKGTNSFSMVAHFDAIADRYREMYEEASPIGVSFVARRQRVLDLFGDIAGKVLDVGCGPGVMVPALSERGCSFFGLDPALKMIQSARKEHPSSPGTHYAVGAAEQLCFPDLSFDAVICMGVLERIDNDRAALEEMVRVLQPGAALIVTMPNRYSPNLIWRDEVFYRIVSLLRPLHQRLKGVSAQQVVRGHRRYTRRSYRRRMDELGCDVVEIDYCVYNAFLAPLDSLLPRLTAAVMQRTEGLHRGPLRALGATLVVTAVKRNPADADRPEA